jgi:hypothetical protein
MKPKPILIDVSLTGGRGPAKKAYELTSDLKKENIPYKILTDKLFEKKLIEAGLKPDYVADVDLTDKPARIIGEFQRVVGKIECAFMVKMGARVAGPIAARKTGLPYILVDGGMPDYLTEDESLYERKTFEKAENVLITTQFPWVFPDRSKLPNIRACGFPISRETWKFIGDLSAMDKMGILSMFNDDIQGRVPKRSGDLLVDLLFTGDVFENKNRVAYGGWLTAKQYDQCLGFVRRFLIDLCERNKKELFIFLDREIVSFVEDIERRYPQLSLLTFKKKWNFQLEIAIQAASDITVSRAANYQPYVAALCKGGEYHDSCAG